MKTKNFPLRKLIRQASAEGRPLPRQEVDAARAKRTKKSGGKSMRFGRSK